MRMESWLLIGSLLLAPLGALHAGTGAEVAIDAGQELLTMRVDGDVAIDTEGEVLDYRLETELQPELKALLDKAIPRWLFHPVVVDGKAIPARTGMRITLAGTKVEGGYRISIDNVTFRNSSGVEAKDRQVRAGLADDLPVDIVLKSRRRGSIAYPRYAVNGQTVVYVRVSPDGKVEEATAVQSSLLNAAGTPEELARARAAMEANAVKGIRTWTFDVKVNAADPTPADFTGYIRVDWVLPGTSGAHAFERTGEWQLENRGPYRTAGWLRGYELAQRIGSSDAGGSAGVGPVASPVRLREGVIGKAL